MARTPVAETTAFTAADVMHERFSTLPADATVADVRDWFAASSHRMMAFLADDGRYAGSLTREDLGGDLDPTRSAADLAHLGPTVAPDAPAHEGYQLAVATQALRIPVVDGDGAVMGVIGVTEDLAAFCGTRLPADSAAPALPAEVSAPDTHSVASRKAEHVALRIDQDAVGLG